MEDSRVLRLLCVIVMVIMNYVTCEDVTYTIKEEQKPNSVVGNIGRDSKIHDMVTDVDFANLRYSLLTQGNAFSSFFTIDGVTGDLFAAKRIDKESLCPFTTACVLNIEVVASNQGSGGVFFESIKIHINVNDINDNEPVFAQQRASIEISESVNIGASFSLTGAVDKDTGENNTLKKYEILPKDGPFGVGFNINIDGSSTVSIIVEKQLDRETKDSYTVTIIARDGGQPSRNGTMIVDINITDYNDNSPKFSDEIYNATVRENTPSQTVIQIVSAIDDDIGKNGEIFYRLSARQSADIHRYFSMNAVSGAISIRTSLEYQTTENMKIIVEASDRGVPPKFSQAIVEVTVIDTDNNPPQIRINMLSGLINALILETASIGSPVAHMAVTDPDSGQNGVVNCYSQNAAFDLRALDKNEYKIVVAKVLDYEESRSYLVTIMCEDSGNPPLNSSEYFTVDVLDANDNKPVFIQTNYAVSIPENNSINDTLLQVVATDADTNTENGRISYRLQDDAYPYFDINPSNGIVKARVVLDREDNASHIFHVLAMDNGIPKNTATAEVIINLLDINDEAPKFEKDSYTFYVYENRNANTIVGNVSAFDPDLGPGGLFVFTLATSDFTTKLPFTISPDGLLSTTRMLDSESQSQHVFTIFATDQGVVSPLTGSTRVTVVVLDENDNTPFFTFPNDANHSLTVYLPISKNSSIVKINAADDDSGVNGKITYTLRSDNVSSLFVINPITGNILVTRDITPADIATYHFTVSAEDGGKISNKLERRFSISFELERVNVGSLGGDGNQNVTIVVALICATILVSAAVLIALFVIKRRDRNRRAKYLESQKSSTGNTEAGKSDVQFKSEREKNGRMNEIEGKDNPAFRMNKSQGQGNNYKQVSESSLKGTSKLNESLDTSTATDIPGGVAVGDHAHQRLIKMASIRLQHDLKLHANHAPIHHKPLTYEAKVREWQDHSRRAEDFHSTSSGEVTTGDSGNGSDEDSHYHHDRNITPTKIRLGVGAVVRNHYNPAPLEKHKTANNLSTTPRQVKFVIPSEDCVSPIYSHYSHSHPSIRSDATEDNDDTTTSGSYSIMMDDIRSELPDFNVVKDIYV
ncbi:hypothetical protein SNE40_017252 [Patella caerulea]|uniref:Cadherin domain-containing protein n=1 Tax=Patella caerulea TaxID=87958 RepID=A0AAN8JGT8_PATCE